MQAWKLAASFRVIPIDFNSPDGSNCLRSYAARMAPTNAMGVAAVPFRGRIS